MPFIRNRIALGILQQNNRGCIRRTPSIYYKQDNRGYIYIYYKQKSRGYATSRTTVDIYTTRRRAVGIL